MEVPPYAGGRYDQDSGRKSPGVDGLYAGFKSELPADVQRLQTESLYPTSALHASPSLTMASPDHMSVSNASTLMPGNNGSAKYVSPQTTGVIGAPRDYQGYGGQDPVLEMQG